MKLFYYDNEYNIYKTSYEARKSRKECNLFYEDDTFTQVDWKTEPPVSLDLLYKLRAEELRTKYEYVILCLSGGIDSRNILETFYKNNILIDEILIVGAFSQDEFKGSTENNNDEIYENTVPFLNQLSLPNTKITYFDYSTLFNQPKQFSLIKDHGDEWYQHIGYWKSATHFFWRDIQKYVASHDKKTCYIMGTSKTVVKGFKDIPFVVFTEADFSDYGMIYQDQNLTRENFYFSTSPISIDIMRKQAHTIIKAYDSCLPEVKGLFYTNYNEVYNKIIYKDVKFPLNKKTRKSRSTFLSVRDGFMLRKENSDIYKIFVDGIAKLKYDIGLNSTAFLSKRYYLK